MSLFGSNTSATSTPSKPLFGGNTALFGSTNVATPPGSNSLFGAAPAAASTPLKPAGSGGLFGSTPASTTSTTTPATGGLFGGGTTTTTTTAPTTGTLFGATSTPQPATGASTLFGATSTPASTAATTGGLFGAKPATTTTSSTLGLGLGVTPAPIGGGSLTLGTAPAATTAPANGTGITASSSGMNFTDFNALLQQLTNEFEDLNHQFVEDVSVLNNYDQLLRDNSKTLIALNDEISKLEQSKSRCTTESDGVNAQLKDITDLVSSLEKELGIADADANLTDCAKNSDANRQHIMKMFLAADAVMQHLEEDVDNLKQQVDALGKLSTVDGTAGNAESFDDIRQILVNQMEQLVYVDKQSEELGQKLLTVRGKI
uniref:Nsp1_C domain-containing protein n=1 Tax=Panagrellus redivivus TaxID=6233 RepID=A0A7E4USA1_PANRE